MFAAKRDAMGQVNVLAKGHENVRLAMTDFYHPFYKMTEHVRFEKCELMGPAAVGLFGCTLDHCTFNECEIVIVRKDRPIRGVVALRVCTLVHCNLFRITLLVTLDQYNAFPEDLKKGLPVISDGETGPL